MTTYRQVRASRGLIWAGIALGYLIAVVIAIVNLRSDSGSTLTALAFLTMLSIPATMAVYSLDRRPSLLTAASMAALIQALVTLSSVGLLLMVLPILWSIANGRRPRPAIAPGWATWGRPALALVAVLPLLVMYLHQDPMCTVRDADGNVISSQVGDSASSGFGFQQLGGSTLSSSSSSGVTTACSSDTVQPWEAALSLSLSVVIIWLVRRWPDTERIESRLSRT